MRLGTSFSRHIHATHFDTASTHASKNRTDTVQDWDWGYIRACPQLNVTTIKHIPEIRSTDRYQSTPRENYLSKSMEICKRRNSTQFLAHTTTHSYMTCTTIKMLKISIQLTSQANVSYMLLIVIIQSDCKSS